MAEMVATADTLKRKLASMKPGEAVITTATGAIVGHRLYPSRSAGNIAAQDLSNRTGQELFVVSKPVTERENPMEYKEVREEENPLTAGVKLALGALVLAGVAGVAYYATRPATTTSTSGGASAAGTPSYTPVAGNTQHNVSLASGNTLLINNPAGATAFTLANGDPSVTSVGQNTVTAVGGAGQGKATTITITWTIGTTTQTDLLYVSIP